MSAITGPLQESSQPASNPEGKPREQLLTKLQEDKTQPDEEEEEEEEEEVEVSDFDSDFSLDGDLPDFGGYEPSTSSDVGRSELLRRRSSTSLHDKGSTSLHDKGGTSLHDKGSTSLHNEGGTFLHNEGGTSLHDKGSAAFVAAPKETSATLTSPESSAAAVTPLSSTAFTPDAGSNNPERSPFGALKERFDSRDDEAGVELSKGVEKVLSFSDQREETGVHQEEGLQGGKEKRQEEEFDGSDWDSKEEEEDVEEELSESVQGTSRQADSLPESKVTPPTWPKADYFSYYDSDSEGEDEIEKAVMPPSAPPPPTAAGAEGKEKLAKDHMPSSLVHAGGVEAVMEQKSPTPTVSIPSPLAPVSSVAGESLSVGTHDTPCTEQKGPATLEQSASSEESETESEWEQDQRLKRNRPPLQVTPNRPKSPPNESVSAEHNDHRLQGSPGEAAASISSESRAGNTERDKVPLHSSEGERGRKHRGPRRETTTVTTDDLAAARIKMEDEASERFHNKQNELQTLLKSRGKWTDSTWVSPCHKAKGESEQRQSPQSPGRIQLPSLLAPRIRTDVPELEMKDSGFTSLEQGAQPSGEGGVVPRGKSKVQLMKEVWESKLPFRQTGADETSGDRLGVCETQGQDSPSPPVSSWLEPQNTFQEDGPHQDTAADMLPEVKAQVSGGNPPCDQKEESEEEILELLSEGDSEGEGGEGREMEREGNRERGEEGEKGREGRVEAGGLLPLETKPLEHVPDDRTTENNALATKLPEPSQVTPKVQEQPKVSSSLPNPGDSCHRSTPVTKEDTTPPWRPRPATKPLSSQTSGDDDITSTESEVRF